MREKMFLARGMSRVLFIVLYALDTFAIYYLTNDLVHTVTGAALIVAVFPFMISIERFKLRACPLKDASQKDALYLQSCMDEVMNRSVSVGRKRKNIKLYIADDDSLNCFTVGNGIIVNKGMLRLGDRSMLAGCISHEVSHVYNIDWFFAALLEMNIVFGMCSLGVVLIGTQLVFIVLTLIIVGVFFSSIAVIAAGTLLGKLAKGVSSVISHCVYFTLKAFSAFLYRRQEFEADRYAVTLGYASALISFFRMREMSERHANRPSRFDDLLSSHPSDYRRVAQIEKLESEITVIEHKKNGRELAIYENLFN